MREETGQNAIIFTPRYPQSRLAKSILPDVNQKLS